MKLLNFIFAVFFATAATFLYTHQQIEAVKLSYDLKAKRAEYDKLLDQREKLEYNVAKLKAPTYLELQLAKKDVKLVLPERWQVFEVAGLKEERAHSLRPLSVRNVLGLFALDREAEATPVTE